MVPAVTGCSGYGRVGLGCTVPGRLGEREPLLHGVRVVKIPTAGGAHPIVVKGGAGLVVGRSACVSCGVRWGVSGKRRHCVEDTEDLGRISRAGAPHR